MSNNKLHHNIDFGSIIKNNILHFLKKKSLTIADLEKKNNLKLSNILYRGDTNPTISTVFGISRALEITVDELLNNSCSIEYSNIPALNAKLGVVIQQNICSLLKQHSVTQADIEKRANIGRVLNNILNRENSNPKINTIYSIAKAFNVSIEELLYNHSHSIKNVEVELYYKSVRSVVEQLTSNKSTVTLSIDRLSDICKEVYNQMQILQRSFLEKKQIKKIIDFYLQKSS